MLKELQILNGASDPHQVKKSLTYLRRSLLEWYKTAGRNYPWRSTSDPYKILIAELMLQRTQANQVAVIYEEFIKRYPTINHLSEAKEEEIGEITFSLGLQSRNQRIKSLALSIASSFGGEIPDQRDDLIKLPGIGQYMAGMYLSSSFNRREWIVDTNVIRIFSRFFGLHIKGRGREDKRIIEIAKEYANCNNAREANYALIDFAALVCKSKKPDHSMCPVNSKCEYFIKCCRETQSTP